MRQFDEITLSEVEHCAQMLSTGGTILYPTDTIWGLGADATNEEAVAKLYAIKERAETKSMIILLADKSSLQHYVSNIPSTLYDYLQKTNKPTTIIYEGAKNLAKNLINADGTIAIRIVKDAFCESLIQKLGRPIVSTSANKSGDAPPHNFSDVNKEIITSVDYVCKYRQKDEALAIASKIVRFTNAGKEIVIRP